MTATVPLSWTRQDGVPTKVVQERLGHSESGITLDVYAHVLPGQQADASARISRVLRHGAVR